MGKKNKNKLKRHNHPPLAGEGKAAPKVKSLKKLEPEHPPIMRMIFLLNEIRTVDECIEAVGLAAMRAEQLEGIPADELCRLAAVQIKKVKKENAARSAAEAEALIAAIEDEGIPVHLKDAEMEAPGTGDALG